MGITVEIYNLEEMCDLMCDNVLPEREEKKEGEKPEEDRTD